MKTLLLTLLLFTSIGAMGQVVSENAPLITYTVKDATPIVNDTIPCLMAVSDSAYTGQMETTLLNRTKGIVFIVRGYQVFDIYGRQLAYLDADKKVMKYRVWISQKEDKR